MKRYKAILGVLGLVALLACSGPPQKGAGTKNDAILITPRQLNDIAAIEWHLKRMKIAGDTVFLIKDSNITFTCDGNGKVAGVASLNRYFGSFTLNEDGKITWSKTFGMTRMAGPPELMDQEVKFMKALPLTTRLYLKKEMLVLTSTDQATALEFEKNEI